MRELDLGFDDLKPALDHENVTRATATRSELIPAYNAAIAEIIAEMEDTKALCRKARDSGGQSALKDLAEKEGHGDFIRMVEKAIDGPAQQHYSDLLDALPEYDDPTLNQICFEEAIELSPELRAARDAADAEAGASGYVALKWQAEGDDGFTSIVKGDGLRFETAFAAVVFYGDPVEKFFWYAMVDVVSGEPGGVSLDGYVTSLDLAKAACEEFINSGISKLFLAQSKDD